MPHLKITYDGKTHFSGEVDELTWSQASGALSLDASFAPNEAPDVSAPTGTALDGLWPFVDALVDEVAPAANQVIDWLIDRALHR